MEYVRPTTVSQALDLLQEDGAHPIGGGTDLLGQIDCRSVSPKMIVDLQDVGLSQITVESERVTLGAHVNIADLPALPALARRQAVVTAANQIASPLIRNLATIGGNLCQDTRCWYYRSPERYCWLKGGDTCFAEIGDHRKHGLEPGHCIAAHQSDLAPALMVNRAVVKVASAVGERMIPLADLYRRPSPENRYGLTLARGEIVTAVVLSEPPDASCYIRAGERRAFTFPLVAVAGARYGAQVELAAAGVATIPLHLDPSDPLAGLPGNPQSAWKRELLAGLVEKCLETLD